MLHLVYSNLFEELCDALVDGIVAARRAEREDVLTGSTILVPNAHVATAVKLAMARREGIAAGLAFPFVEVFFARGVARVRDDVAVLDRGKLQLLVHGALCDADLLAEEVMAPVRAYLDAAGDDGAARSLRRVQLSSQIAGLYGDYAVYRPELFAAWHERRARLADTEHAATEAWQARLWLALAGDSGALASIRRDTGVSYRLLPHIVAELPPAELGIPASLHAIGFSHLSPGYQAMLARAAEVCELSVYALNPCMEFWEDLPAGWEVRAERRRIGRRGAPAPAGGAPDDPPALRLWGRPGRETVRMLDELSDCDFEPRFVDPRADGSPTALAALQRDILARAPERTEPVSQLRDDDDSIRVLACPSARRELEIIGGEIRSLVAADPGLRYNDVAILVARGAEDTYQAQVGSVFHELGDIPHHVVDRPLHVESRYAEALELLLELPLGRFTRPELCRVLTHPAVLAGAPEVDTADWIRWIDSLGVAHGADRRDHEGTYIDGDVFNWDQALRRLALGALMTGARSGDDRAVDLGGHRYVPEELAAGERESATHLIALARSLIADARYARSATMPLAGWRDFFDALAESYLVPRTDADERHLEACRAALAGLVDMDLEDRPVDYRCARELARGALASLRVSRGELFADGVLVAPLSPMRPLPFRVLFVAGLGQGQFPSSRSASPIDLREGEIRPGDVSPSERDRYTFLEALLSARDRFYVSYVARDEESGEELAPSSVVSELVDIVERGYRPIGAPALVCRFPLRAYDPRAVPEPFAWAGEKVPPSPRSSSPSPVARSQAGALALRRHLQRHLSETRAAPDELAPDPAAVRAALGDPERADLRARLRVRQPTAPPRDDDVEAGAEIPLSLGVLRRFLDAPIQAWAQAILQLRDDEFDDDTAREDEPFAADPATRATLLRGAFAAIVGADDQEPAALERAYDEHRDRLARAGRAPVGPFSDIERERHRHVLERWREGVQEVFPAGLRATAPIHIGRASPHAEVERIAPAVILEGAGPASAPGARARHVSLYGTTQLVDARGASILVCDTSASGRDAMVLRGLLDHAVLAAAGVGDGAPRLLVHLHAIATRCYELAPFSAAEARFYLADLAAELFGQSHAYLLPGEEALRYLRKPERTSLADKILALRDSGRLERGYELVRGLHRFEPPPDAEAVARRRIGPLHAKEIARR